MAINVPKKPVPGPMHLIATYRFPYDVNKSKYLPTGAIQQIRPTRPSPQSKPPADAHSLPSDSSEQPGDIGGGVFKAALRPATSFKTLLSSRTELLNFLIASVSSQRLIFICGNQNCKIWIYKSFLNWHKMSRILARG